MTKVQCVRQSPQDERRGVWSNPNKKVGTVSDDARRLSGEEITSQEGGYPCGGGATDVKKEGIFEEKFCKQV